MLQLNSSSEEDDSSMQLDTPPHQLAARHVAAAAQAADSFNVSAAVQATPVRPTQSRGVAGAFAAAVPASAVSSSSFFASPAPSNPSVMRSGGGGVGDVFHAANLFHSTPVALAADKDSSSHDHDASAGDLAAAAVDPADVDVSEDVSSANVAADLLAMGMSAEDVAALLAEERAVRQEQAAAERHEQQRMYSMERSR
jgi:hypothetical protein